MGFFARLFGREGHDAVKVREAVRTELDIPSAIEVHMKWKGRLQSYLDGNSAEELDPMVICRDDQCALGKWIHGPALKHFHDDEGFHKLRSDHANFHFIAGSVVKKVQDNDRAGSEALLRGDYARASREVIQDLTELDRHLHGKS
jgi:methyl-accepting chemotaxis protein